MAITPLRAVYWAAAVALLGWLVFAKCKRVGAIRSNDNQTTPPPFSPFWYSLDLFIPLVNLHQESYYVVSTEWPHSIWRRALLGYVGAHVLAGWVLTTFLVAGVTGIFAF